MPVLCLVMRTPTLTCHGLVSLVVTSVMSCFAMAIVIHKPCAGPRLAIDSLRPPEALHVHFDEGWHQIELPVSVQSAQYHQRRELAEPTKLLWYGSDSRAELITSVQRGPCFVQCAVRPSLHDARHWRCTGSLLMVSTNTKASSCTKHWANKRKTSK